MARGTEGIGQLRPVAAVPPREAWAPVHPAAQRAAATAISSGGSVLIWGEGGAGKSVLLERLGHHHDGPVLRGGGLASLRWEPYLAFSRALRVPVPAGDRIAAAGFVLEAAGRDALVVLDDLQWVDPDSLSILAVLAGQISLLTAATPGEGAAEARGAAVAAGFELHPLAPVDEATMAEVVRAANPCLDATTVDRTVCAAGGNPRVAALLATDPSGGDARRVLVRRAARFDRAGRTALAALGLLGRPAPEGLLGPGLRSLVEADEVVVERGLVHMRVPLLAQVAADQLDGVERAALHARLAAVLTDPGEAARHHEAAGDGLDAYPAGLAAAAAASPGEAARHLALVARTADAVHPADPDAADQVRVQAALDISAVGENRLALACLEAVDTASLTVRDLAAVALVDARASLAAGDPGGAREAVAAALERTDDAEMRALLLVEGARAALTTDQAAALADARAAVAAASHDDLRARALVVAGTAMLAAGAEGWHEPLDEAVELAGRCGSVAVESAATTVLAAGWVQAGEPARAETVAAAGVTRARAAGLDAWVARLDGIQLWLALHHHGDVQGAIALGNQLLDRALPPEVRTDVTACLALACADGGDLDRAAELLDAQSGPRSATGLGGWTRAEVERLAGTGGTGRPSPSGSTRTQRRLGRAGPSPVAGAVGLTTREREILELVATGSTTPVIARRLSIAPSTVETHVKTTMRKLGVPNRTAAAVKAFRQ